MTIKAQLLTWWENKGPITFTEALNFYCAASKVHDKRYYRGQGCDRGHAHKQLGRILRDCGLKLGPARSHARWILKGK